MAKFLSFAHKIVLFTQKLKPMAIADLLLTFTFSVILSQVSLCWLNRGIFLDLEIGEFGIKVLFWFQWDTLKCPKGHFTKVYSIKGCEPQNFSKFPWDPLIGLGCIHCVQGELRLF